MFFSRHLLRGAERDSIFDMRARHAVPLRITAHDGARFLLPAIKKRILVLSMFLWLPLASCCDQGAGGFETAPAPLLRANRPFPQHVPYTEGTIRPGNVTQSRMDDAVKAFYDAWKTHYLKRGCSAGQYYVWFDSGSGAASRDAAVSVSEGHGYGMIIVALMAGYDANAKPYFDGLYRYYKSHLSAGTRLMAWNQIKGCVDADTPENNGNASASDADMDIAYALLLAHKQWGSSGSINYRQEAILLINDIMTHEVNHQTWTVTPGNWVSPDSQDEYNATRASDFMPDHFRVFQAVTGDSRWAHVLNEAYSLTGTIQTGYSPKTGLIPDFITSVDSEPEPAAANRFEGDGDGAYFYNACRLPWRIAVHYLMSGDTRAKTVLDKINSWIQSRTRGTPSRIRAGYALDGADLPGNDYMSAAFTAPLAVSAMVNQANQSWLDDLWLFMLESDRDEFRDGSKMYYENTIQMLCLIALSGNWWAP